MTSHNKMQVQDHTISTWFVQHSNTDPGLCEACATSSALESMDKSQSHVPCAIGNNSHGNNYYKQK